MPAEADTGRISRRCAFCRLPAARNVVAARRRRRRWGRGRRRRGRPCPTAVMVVVIVVACVVRTVSGEACSGQGEGGEDRHEDFLVVRFITSSLSALVGLTEREVATDVESDTFDKDFLASATCAQPSSVDWRSGPGITPNKLMKFPFFLFNYPYSIFACRSHSGAASTRRQVSSGRTCARRAVNSGSAARRSPAKWRASAPAAPSRASTCRSTTKCRPSSIDCLPTSASPCRGRACRARSSTRADDHTCRTSCADRPRAHSPCPAAVR